MIEEEKSAATPITKPNHSQLPMTHTPGTAAAAGDGDGLGGHWLQPNNPEFDQIHCYLNTCIGADRMSHNLEIWKIENLESNYRYERKTSNMLKVACWMNANDLSANAGNTLESICKKGFRFDKLPSDGMEFHTGTVHLPDTLSTTSTQQYFIYVEVAVGKSFVCDKASVGTERGTMIIPTGYDSLYLTNRPLDRNNDGEFDLQEYQAAAHFDERDASEYSHRYFIKDTVQVCPKYVVRFELKRSTPLRHPAQLKKEGTEQLQQRSSTVGRFTPQKDHSDAIDSSILGTQGGGEDELAYFDPVTLSAISRRDRLMSSYGTIGTMGRSHSPGSSGAANRDLSSPLAATSASNMSSIIPVDDAFARAVVDCQARNQDPLVNNKRNWIDENLNSLDDKVREINLNYAETSEAIAEAAAAAMSRLQQLTRSKLETCLSMEIELRRQSEQLAWLDSQMEAQLKIAKAAQHDTMLSRNEKVQRQVEFMKAWKYFSVFRNAVSRSKPTELQQLKNTRGDIKVSADISLYTDPFFGSDGEEDPDNGQHYRDKRIDLTRSQSHQELQQLSEQERLLHIARKTVSHLVPLQPTEMLVSSALQNIVEDEMDAIQDALRNVIYGNFNSGTRNATVGEGSRYAEDSLERSRKQAETLPMSVVRPILGGTRPELKLHELLDNILDQDDVDGQDVAMNGDAAQQVAESVIGSSNATLDQTTASEAAAGRVAAAAIKRVFDSPSENGVPIHPNVIQEPSGDAVRTGSLDMLMMMPPPQNTPAATMFATILKQRAELRNQSQISGGGTHSSFKYALSKSLGHSYAGTNGDLAQYATAASINVNTPYMGIRDHKNEGDASQQEHMQDLLRTDTEGVYKPLVPLIEAVAKMHTEHVIKAKSQPPVAESQPPLPSDSPPDSPPDSKVSEETPPQQPDEVASGNKSAEGIAVEEKKPRVKISSSGSIDNKSDSKRSNRTPSPGAARLIATPTRTDTADVESNASPQLSVNGVHLNISMSNKQLLPTVERFPTYRMSIVAERKRKQLLTKMGNKLHDAESKVVLELQRHSAVLQHPEQAEYIFYSLPIFAKPPTCKLIYSSSTMRRSLSGMFSATARHRGPSILLIRSKNMAFGSFLSHQILPSCTWTGSPSCFIFNLTLDIKFPYHARTAYGNVSEGMAGRGVTPLAFYVQSDTFYMGYGDLTLEDTLQRGSSELENTYGCGLTPQSPEALCMLAGSPIFDIDVVEVWAIS